MPSHQMLLKTMKISYCMKQSVFDRFNIVKETDIRNACELVSKVHDEMKESVEEVKSGDGVLSLITR